MATQSTGASGADADGRAEAAMLLARYPDLSERELGMLKHWFKSVAGPLDVGLLASDPAIAEQYRAYRKDHHDRFSAKDIAIGALFAAIAVCVVGIMIMMVP
ncbi:hypothetical protein [Novosphingobium sp. AP12]|uniref:hypothetical protein n=1 Tax=Novosphingobium sp. AP12 TaxID=1144305 RepID=UPI0002721FA1|nr:hypothetical protein [Novosphingobium sp. AP12]EJL20714.1 hypothetical protein PMI02_05451 [Novosphingobium sp. AP12]